MKKLFIAFLLLSSVALSFAADYETPAGGAQEGTDVNFASITAESIELTNRGDKDNPSFDLHSGTGFFTQDNVNYPAGFTYVGADPFFFNGNGIRGKTNGNPYTLFIFVTTATTPVYTFNGDTNTGIGSAGADQLSLIAGGVEGVRTYKNGVDLKGAVAFSGISSITADYAIGNFDADPTWFIPCDATLGNISTTLPPVADKLGRLIEMKLTSAANGCYFDGNGAETIDGVAGKSITTQYTTISLIAGLTEWLIR